MGQRAAKVCPITDDGVYDTRLSAPPTPSSTDGELQHPHPRDETPVGAGGGDAGQEAGKVREKGKRRKWWRRLTSFFKTAPKDLPQSGPCHQQEEGEQVRVAWAGRSSDEYVFSHYSVGDVLGKGGFAVVFEGRRLDDGLRVALKYVTKTKHMQCMSIPGHRKPLPKEIALTILANRGPSVPQIITLLDWHDQPDHYVMVLECPSPCETLAEFAWRHGGSLDEDTTRRIMWQAVHAANVCCRRGVFHRDIKLDNLLINRRTLEVKLIDFGCGDVLRWLPYKTYAGTAEYSPPEYHSKGKYRGRSATVWSLGIVMFVLLYGRFPIGYDIFQLKYKRWFKPGLSEECCGLLRELLHDRQSGRIGLGRIQHHSWFKVATEVQASRRLP